MMRRLILALTVIALIGTAAPAFAQKYQNLGRGKCVNCHDHDNEKLWSEKKDGPPPNNHLNALKQMESPKSKAFADATGVKDVYDPASSCVRCHATVVKGDVSGGITCESCHGPGSGYLEPHQKKDAYSQAVAAGMNDFVKKSNNWAGACIKCHVMDDGRLVAAKHPSGDDFDLGAKFGVVATGHWKSSYDRGPISAAGKAAAAPLIAARGGKSAPAVAAVPAAPAAAPAAQVAAAPPPPAAAPTAAAKAPPAPPPLAATPSTPAAVSPRPASVARPSAPPPAAAAPAPTPPVGLPAPAGMTPSPATTPDTAAAPPPVLSLPQSPSAAVAEIQGRTIALIDELLRRGGRAPVRVVPPARKTQYRGADADLLRLQEDVLALAIEALGTAPPADVKQPAGK